MPSAELVGEGGLAQTLPELLTRHAARQSPALILADRELTFRELSEESARVARGLRDLGIGEGDRVAIWLPSGTAWLACLFGCAQIGAIAVAVNTRFGSREVSDILCRTGSRAVVLRPDLAGTLSGCAPEQLRALEWLILDGSNGAEASFPDDVPVRAKPYREIAGSEPLGESVASPTSPCIVFTTSGTTKAPKFVLHAQGALIRHGRDIAAAIGLTANGRMLLIPPMCGTYGLVTTFAALVAGAPLIVMDGWNAAEALRLGNQHRATHTMATDDAVAQILAQNDEPRPMPSMAFVGLAGVNPALGDIYERAQPRGLHLVGLYGSSELQAAAAIQRPEGSIEDRAGRGGFMVGAAGKVRACDPATSAPLPHGEMGELEFQAPDSRMLGYLGDEEATRSAHRPDGFFRTGDLGYTLADGRVIFVSRLGDSLRLGGFLVNPAEIEEVIEEVDGIGQAQVVGVETPAGLRPVAFAIPDQALPIDEEAVRRHVSGKLARFKVPIRVFPIDTFPVTVSANATKIQKGKLRDLAASLLALGLEPARAVQSEPPTS